jgi:hypothetical protein
MGRPRFEGLAALNPKLTHWEDAPYWRTLPYDPPLTAEELSTSLPALVLRDKKLAEEPDES